MSRLNLNLIDYILKPNAEEDLDSVLELKKDMDNIDMRLCDENSDLMSSEFFDSVLSLEQEGLNNEHPSIFTELNSDMDLNSEVDLNSENSSHGDEGTSTKSSSSDSGQWSTCNDIAFSDLDVNFINDSIDVDVQGRTGLNNMYTPIKKKIMITKPYMNTNRKYNSNVKQVLRVQSISGNGRSLLLPFNMANVKSIKLVKANDLKSANIKLTNLKASMPIEKLQMNSTIEPVDLSDDNDNHYPPLILTDEEKRVLSKEGIQLPTHYPLTKKEERELKRIRRKIRNKISAQDSRKRKKEYVDSLEERVKRGCEENKFLLKRVKQLQKQNNKLMGQMSKLQALIFNTSSSKAAPTTCLMIVLFSALLVSLPNMRLSQETKIEHQQQQQVAARRALLFSQQATNEDDTLNIEELLFFNKDDSAELENIFNEEENNTDKEYGFSKFDRKYDLVDKNAPADVINAYKNIQDNLKNTLNNIKNALKGPEFKGDGRETKHGYIEPDIDDIFNPEDSRYLPPNKKMKIDQNSNEYDYQHGQSTFATVQKTAFSVNDSQKE